MLVCSNLKKVYLNKTAVEDISLKLEPEGYTHCWGRMEVEKPHL